MIEHEYPVNYFNQESERLRFRKLTDDDKPSWVEFFENNDRLHFLGIDLTQSKTTLAEDWIERQFERYRNCGLGHLAVELKETHEFIGLGGILPRDLNGQEEFEIAYSLKPTFWGKGYGTEIARQLKGFGLKNIETSRLISIIHIENLPSINVARKNGMSLFWRTTYYGMLVNVYGIEKI